MSAAGVLAELRALRKYIAILKDVRKRRGTARTLPRVRVCTG